MGKYRKCKEIKHFHLLLQISKFWQFSAVIRNEEKNIFSWEQCGLKNKRFHFLYNSQARSLLVETLNIDCLSSLSLISLIKSPHYVLFSRDILESLAHKANEKLFLFITYYFFMFTPYKKKKTNQKTPKPPPWTKQTKFLQLWKKKSSLKSKHNEDLKNPFQILAKALLKTYSPNC